MAFDADIKHWPTLAAFTTVLERTPRPAWCHAICVHNTYIPNEHQWRGIASVQSCLATYVGKGWSAGPHLFLAAEAPSSDHTGIFQLTPLTHIGVHAGPCNDDHLGIEVVGDFQARPPTPAQYGLLLAVARAILQAWMLTPDHVQVHNECMSGRTCPGKFLVASQLRADLAERAKAPPSLLIYRARGLPIYERQSLAGPLAGHLASGEQVQIDVTYPGGVGHLQDRRGFVDMAGLEVV